MHTGALQKIPQRFWMRQSQAVTWHRQLHSVWWAGSVAQPWKHLPRLVLQVAQVVPAGFGLTQNRLAQVKPAAHVPPGRQQAWLSPPQVQLPLAQLTPSPL